MTLLIKNNKCPCNIIVQYLSQYIMGKGGNVTCNKAAVFGGCVLARCEAE